MIIQLTFKSELLSLSVITVFLHTGNCMQFKLLMKHMQRILHDIVAIHINLPGNSVLSSY